MTQVIDDALLATVSGSTSTTLCTQTIVYTVCNYYPVADGNGGYHYEEECHEEYSYIIYDC